MQVKSIAECSKGTFIKLQFVIKTFVLFIFEWPFYTDFTVTCSNSEGGNGHDMLSVLHLFLEFCRVDYIH